MDGTMCADRCNDALNYAKGKGTLYAKLVKTMQDCANLCDLRQKFEERGSDLLQQANALCAEACARCASECEAMNDENLRQCIEECRACATHCR